MSPTSAENRRVFLACRPIFTGSSAQVRKRRPILEIVNRHRKPLKQLLADIGIDRVVEILGSLLERRTFESESRARKAFPELYATSPSQNVRRAESENDAARSTAELMNEIESSAGQFDSHGVSEDWAFSQAGGPSIIPRLEKGKHEDKDQATPQSPMPTLFPLYFPYSAQHVLLNAAQRVLEECCYDFFKIWLPNVIESGAWDCAEAVELTKWLSIVKQNLESIPAHAVVLEDDSNLVEILAATHNLRHAAVHRLPTTARQINQLIKNGLRLVNALRDSERAAQFEDMLQMIESQIKAMELNKNALEEKLRSEVELIEKKRRELDLQEQECISAILKENGDHNALVAELLELQVWKVFHGFDIGQGPIGESKTAGEGQMSDVTEDDHQGHENDYGEDQSK